MTRPLCLCIMLVGVSAWSACASHARPASQMAVLTQEETPEKLLARGRAFVSVGDYPRAEQYFAGALDRGADPALVLPLLLRACAEERRFRAAIDYAEPVLRKRPDDFRLRFVVASLYTTVGDVEEARRELDRITEESPSFAPAHFDLARLLRDEDGDVVKADEHFREYLRLDPTGPHAEEAKGSLLRLKVVDRGLHAVTKPPEHPLWRDVNATPKEPATRGTTP